ncbi:ABC transporter permease [Echinicola sp. CAU 1574]|uniref:ABC transporter permease n=1 Tax=Echinicola arenosa TaxID=2774144 RepID=A0ABR9ASP1_9BACT|nr:ABC transporter permease [Echinicola arenosa]MBD8490925.1 ABC transporter permease [Echinicola arenosa]
MLRNYLKIAWRNLLKNKVFSLINILGLSLGLATCFLIYQYVRYERSFDEFHEKSERIYRVPISYTGSFASVPPTAANHPALGPAMKSDFAEVEDFARMVRATLFIGGSQLSDFTDENNPVTFNVEKLFLADASLLDVFSFPLVEGDVSRALKEPETIVITEKLAKKYFGDEPAVGKVLSLNKELDLTVTGVLKDLPQNSHLQFDALISFATLGEQWGYDTWIWPEFYNYILLRSGADPSAVEKQFPAFTEKYLGEVQRQNNFQSHFTLQPLADIHLKSHLLLEQSANGSDRTVYFLSLLALFILLMAWINYLNLSTAKAMERSKEVGVRKVAGAARSQLIAQFFVDVMLVNMLAIGIAIILVIIAWGPFERLVEVDMTAFIFSSSGTASFTQWGYLIMMFLLGVIFLGAYPAMLLSSYNPSLVLRGKFIKSKFGATLRKSLVTFQYVLTIVLVGGSMVIFQQLRYMQNQDLGYNKDEILVVNRPVVSSDDYQNSSLYFREEVERLSAINAVTYSTDIPGEQIKGRNQVRRINQEQGGGIVVYQLGIDENFVSTYDLELVAGRGLGDRDKPLYLDGTEDFDNPAPLLINERLVEQLGYLTSEEAIAKKVYFKMGPEFITGEIIGVLKNYHQLSLKEDIDPVLYYFTPPGSFTFASVNMNILAVEQTMEAIQKVYDQSFSGNPFDYFFLNEYFDQQYRADKTFGAVFRIFTVFAIIVAALGLLGLAIFTVEQHTKEVGIRKVLGASASDILVIFTSNFVKLLLLSYLLGGPIIYFVSKKWLQNFKYRIDLGWDILVMPLILMLVITIVTVMAISLKTALSNPIKSLRYE